MSEESRKSRFERTAVPHLSAAYNLARWLVRRPADAEDVVQEAMLRAYRSFDGCRPETVRPWLLRIVRNAALDSLQAAGGRLVGFADLDPEDADGTRHTADAFTAETEDPEALLVRAEDRRHMDRLIAGLPADFREVVVLRDLEGLSYKEIAAVVGIPLGTVMSRLARGRDLLHKAWSES